MNLSKLVSNKGHRLGLLPPATVASLKGVAEPINDPWLLIEVTRDRLQLVNERTQQALVLQPDHVHHYTSGTFQMAFDGFLELNVLVDITLNEPRVSVIPSGAARTLHREEPQPLQFRLEALMNRINPEIMRAAVSRRGPVPVMIGPYHLHILNELRNEPGFDELLTVQGNGNFCVGVNNRIGGHIHDLDELGGLQGVVLHFRGPVGSGGRLPDVAT